jgi:DNA-binding NarL/FixJ family response regulator
VLPPVQTREGSGAESRGEKMSLPPKGTQLTPREKEVLELLIKGYFREEIADMLSIKKTTVHVHCDNIHARLDLAKGSHILQGLARKQHGLPNLNAARRVPA